MNRARQEESYCESEFDIYQEYQSSYDSNNNNNSNSADDPLENPRGNHRRSKNMSEVVVSKDNEANNSQLGNLFQRPSLTMKAERDHKKKSLTKKEKSNFRNQIKSWFIHK